MPTKLPWDEDSAGQALAQAMAERYGLSQEAVLIWYHKAIKALENLDQARDAVQNLIEEPFVVATHGYKEQDQNAYHEHYWTKLTEALGITEQFCSECGQWYPPGPHPCLSQTRENREKVMEDPNKTAEVFLLSYSPLLHDYALQQLVNVLENTVTTIEGESCMLGDIRIDEKEHKIYGKGHKLQTYGEYV